MNDDPRITWGLYAGPVDLLATTKSFTIEGAIAYFEKLPAHIRGRVVPSNQTVRAMP